MPHGGLSKAGAPATQKRILLTPPWQDANAEDVQRPAAVGASQLYSNAHDPANLDISLPRDRRGRRIAIPLRQTHQGPLRVLWRFPFRHGAVDDRD